MRAVLTALAATAIVLGAAAGHAQSAAECQQLWVQRNQIFKNRGYCFRTQAAIAYFGNVGCIYGNQDAVPLADSERSYIRQIVARERVLRCQVDSGPPVQTFPAPVPTPTPVGPTPSGPAPPPGAPNDACRKFPGLC
jgi:YARHG domain